MCLRPAVLTSCKYCMYVHTYTYMYSMYVLTTVGTSYLIAFVSSIKWPHCTEVSACTGPDGAV